MKHSVLNTPESTSPYTAGVAFASSEVPEIEDYYQAAEDDEDDENEEEVARIGAVLKPPHGPVWIFPPDRGRFSPHPALYETMWVPVNPFQK